MEGYHPLVVGRAYPASALPRGYIRKGGRNPDQSQIEERPAPPTSGSGVKPPLSGASTRTFSIRTPAGKALALVHELREEKKISSGDVAVLIAVIESIAFAERAALPD